MKTSHGVMILCVLAAVTLICESARQHLSSIDDLKTVDFGGSVPRQSLLLLHWFANQVNFDQYGHSPLTFDPTTDFGSHHYGNFEGLLDRPPMGYQYYTVGNLNQDFPYYVRYPPQRDNDGENRVRIVFSAQRVNNNYRVHRMFLTQHEGPDASNYDRTHTYEITNSLLWDIRWLSPDTVVSDILQSRVLQPGNDSDCFRCIMFTIFILVFIFIISFLSTIK